MDEGYTYQAEAERRRRLYTTDELLERIEQLQLADVIHAPEELPATVGDVMAGIGVPRRSRMPTTLLDLHDYVFRVQERFLRSAPSIEPPARVRGRRPLERFGPITIPRLSLPSRHRFGSQAEWLDMVRLTVQRAYDTTAYLTAQMQALERRSDPSNDALASRRAQQLSLARTALANLSTAAERVTGSQPQVEQAAALPRTGRIEVRDLVIDLDRGEVRRGGQPVALTAAEHTILVGLATAPGHVRTRVALQHLVSGDDPRPELDSSNVEVLTARLRSKLGDSSCLETVPRLGYRLAVRSAALTEGPAVERRQTRQDWARGSAGSPPPHAPGASRGPRPRRLGR